MTFIINIPRPITIFAANKLADVDYNIANPVTDVVAEIVKWGYNNEQTWICNYAVESLQFLDNIGTLFIMIVVWMVEHTK
mgnify:CR=1 FL=1|tara:strand:- start:2776 stop:3015 length:240 start_codon:yes stop_codon:yes gene_type:complete